MQNVITRINNNSLKKIPLRRNDLRAKAIKEASIKDYVDTENQMQRMGLAQRARLCTVIIQSLNTEHIISIALEYIM